MDGMVFSFTLLVSVFSSGRATVRSHSSSSIFESRSDFTQSRSDWSGPENGKPGDVRGGRIHYHVTGGRRLSRAWRLTPGPDEPGCGRARGLSMQIWLPAAKYPGAQGLDAFFEQLLPRVRALPGVTSASLVNCPPLGLLGTTVGVEGGTAADLQAAPTVHYWVVGADYFRTVGLPVLRGRSLQEQDTGRTAGAVVISERLAERLFPGQDPIGQQLRPRFPTNTNAFWVPQAMGGAYTVAGVVPDIQEEGLFPPMPQMYLAYPQNPTRVAHLLVRTADRDPRGTRARNNLF